jgi:hypothetical protein
VRLTSRFISETSPDSGISVGITGLQVLNN